MGSLFMSRGRMPRPGLLTPGTLLFLALCLPGPSQAGTPKLATGNGHGAWLKPDGTVWTWGANNHGELGREDGEARALAQTPARVPARVPGISEARDIACAGHSTFVVVDGGQVLAFGENEYGQLGNGSTAQSAKPLQVPDIPAMVSVSAAHRSVAALAQDGAVWEWGDDPKGSKPRRIGTLGGVRAVARAETHGAALKKDGTVWVWGSHGAGDLGNGCYSCAGEPILVPGLTEVAAIAAGYQVTVALKKDGSVWTIGYGEAGQLGDGARRSVDRPVRVSSLAGVQAVAAGYMHVLALKQDGTVWAWGDNRFGELGNPSVDASSKDMNPDNRALPVRCGSLSKIVAIAAGGRHSLALTSGGVLMGFGDNDNGVLGADPDSLRQADAPMAVGQPVPETCQVLFSCQTASGKYIRLCGEQDENDGELWHNVTYRFGPANGPPELIYPGNQGADKPALFFSHTEAGGDYRVTVRFVSGGYTYRVFSGSKSGAGVRVEDTKGKRVASVACIERPELFASYLWKSLPCDRTNPHGEEACRETPYKGK